MLTQGRILETCRLSVRIFLSAFVLSTIAVGMAGAASNYRPLRASGFQPADRGVRDSFDAGDRELPPRFPANGRYRDERRSFSIGLERREPDPGFDRSDERPSHRRLPSRSDGFRSNRLPSDLFHGDPGGATDSFGLAIPSGQDIARWRQDQFDREEPGSRPEERPFVPRGGRQGFPERAFPRYEQRRAPSHTDERPDPQELISRRYHDPAVLHFISTVSPDRVLAMYAETLQLIESRHLAPPPPQALVEHGIANVLAALRNPSFAQVNRLALAPQQSEGAAQMLAGQLERMPVRSSADAVAVLQTAMQIAAQQWQLSPVAVGIEFEYGAIEALDRYSAFVPPETARATSQQLGEAMVGIGVQIEAAEEGVRIQKVIPDGPAAQAGLERGDLIVAVDDQRLAGRDLETVSSLLAGPAGAAVRLTIVRQGAPLMPIALARRNIVVQSVTDVQMLDPSAGVGYMKLESFAANSASEMEQALWGLQQQGMRSLILDLRGDPGGLLTTAIEVANLFLPEGTIVSTRGRNPSDNTTETATHPRTWKVPLVVLVDENSASASEILAAAIQDNGRGTIVGQRTYGKGTVQTLFPLETVSAGLRLTTAKFYAPSGREMAGAGVEPDVPVPPAPGEPEGDLRRDRVLQAALGVAVGGDVER